MKRGPRWSRVTIALGVIAALAIASPVFGISRSIKRAIKKEVTAQIEKATGPTGPAGTAGLPGSSAASMLAGVVPNAETSEGIGVSSGAVPIGTETGITGANNTVSPNATVVLRDLFVVLNVAPGAGSSRRLELRAPDQANSIGCTICDAETSCNSGSQAVTVPPGTSLQLRMLNDPDTAPAGSKIDFAYRALTP